MKWQFAPQNKDRRVARYYHEAEAQISVSERPLKNGLREDRRFIFCDVSGTDTAIYSTTGGLTRDELELVTVPANSSVIDELLPEDVSQLKPDHEWQHSDTLLARLLNLHAVTANDVKSKVANTDDELIRMESTEMLSAPSTEF